MNQISVALAPETDYANRYPLSTNMRDIHISYLENDKSRECERILLSLPEWFGIESAIENYCKEVDELPVLVATTKDNVVCGLVSLRHRNAATSEIRGGEDFVRLN